MAYTKGPWKVYVDKRDSDLRDGVMNAYIDAKTSRLAYVFDVDKREGMANAALIAKTPVMYETLVWIKEYLETTLDTDGPVYEKVCAAIALVEREG